VCHEAYCRICGGLIERKASGKGRVPEYHPACKVFAQALLNLDRSLDDVKFQRPEAAQAMRSSLMMVLNRIPVQYHNVRRNGSFVAEEA